MGEKGLFSRLLSSPQKLVKIQVPIQNRLNLGSILYSFQEFKQVVVDPQNPKEQAVIKADKDTFLKYYKRLNDLCSMLSISFEKQEIFSQSDFEAVVKTKQFYAELDNLLSNIEEKVKRLYSSVTKLGSERNMFSKLSYFSEQLARDDLPISILTTGTQTFSALGDIPTFNEDIIRFYLREVTNNELLLLIVPGPNPAYKLLLVITIPEHKEEVERILSTYNFSSSSYDFNVLKEYFDEKNTQGKSINELERSITPRLEQDEQELNRIREQHASILQKYLHLTNLGFKFLKYSELGKTTGDKLTVWGWIKQDMFDQLRTKIESLSLGATIKLFDDVPLEYKKGKNVIEDIELPRAEVTKSQDHSESSIIDHSHDHHSKKKGGVLFPKSASFVKVKSDAKSHREFISFIHQLKILQPEKVGGQTQTQKEKITSSNQKLSRYQTRVNTIQESLHIKVSELSVSSTLELVNDFSYSEAYITNFLTDFEQKAKELSDDYNLKNKRLLQLEVLLPLEEQLKEKGLDASLFDSGIHTVLYLGSIPEKQVKAVKFFLNEVTDGQVLIFIPEQEIKTNSVNILIISLKDHSFAIERVLSEYSFEAINYDLSTTPSKKTIQAEIIELKKEIESILESIFLLKEEALLRLPFVLQIIELEKSNNNTLEFCKLTEDTITMWGWVPEKQLKLLKEKVSNAEFPLEIEENANVPIANPSIIPKGKIFGAVRGLINGIGTPTNKEIDPYILLRVTFPLIFGIMFADVGHGLMLMLVGALLVYRKYKKNIKPSETITGYIYAGAELLIICGLYATFFGVMFGKFMGDKDFIKETARSLGITWIPVMQPLYEISLFLTFSLVIGFFMIQLGIWLKFIQNMKFGHGAASKLAPVTLSIIYIGIFAILYNIIGAGAESITFNFALPAIPSDAMTIVVILTLALIPFLFIVEYMHAKGDGILDTIDHLIALFSNTLSFSRIMALLLVHAILSSLPFMLIEGIVRFSFWWWFAALLVGFLIILPIEGLFTFLNVLRLHWVEFFTKFYTGTGTPFTPLSVEMTNIVLISNKGD